MNTMISKEKISDAMEIVVEINDENVFCICPSCECEVNVDLSEVFIEKINEEYVNEIRKRNDGFSTFFSRTG